MAYEIWIRRNETGEARLGDSSEHDWDDVQDRMWGRGRGNYGIDLNRHLMFAEDEDEKKANWPLYWAGDYDAFLRLDDGRVFALDRRPPGRLPKRLGAFAFKPLDASKLPPFSVACDMVPA